MSKQLSHLACAALVAIGLATGARAQSAAFSNQTTAAGLTATMSISGITDPNYPGGGTVGDFNGDGWIDIFWLSGGGSGQLDKLFINNGNGTFTDQAAAWGLATEAHKGKGACTWDYDDDGDLDIYVTSNGPWTAQAVGHHKLFRNNGDGTFTNVATAAGVNMTVTSTPADGWSASPNDYDLDGDLDLFVGGSKGNNVGSKMFRNNGDGTFTDVTSSIGNGGGGLFAGVSPAVYGFSPRFVDVNGDHYPELLFAADFGSSVFFKNNGDGTFTNWSSQSNTTQEENGMGSTIGDYDNDGLVDWYVTSIYFPSIGWTGDKLYINQGGLAFDETSVAAGVFDGGYGWGTASVDFNHDGWQDLVETNGGGCPGSFCNEQSYLWMNDKDGTFTEMAVASGLNHTLQGRALMTFDLENDGDQDVAICSNNAAFRFYRNDLAAGADTHWLRVFLDTYGDPTLAPHGIGATVSIDIGGSKQYRWIESATNFLSTSELSAHFGLGTATSVDVLRVDWPDGSFNELTDVAADQSIPVVSGSTPTVWTDLGQGKAGSSGVPELTGTGTLVGGSNNQLDLTGAAPSSTATLVFGLSTLNVPFKGGTMVPSVFALFTLATDPGGAVTLPFVMTTGIPAGVGLYFQYWISDTGATYNLSASNGLLGTTP